MTDYYDSNNKAKSTQTSTKVSSGDSDFLRAAEKMDASKTPEDKALAKFFVDNLNKNVASGIEDDPSFSEADKEQLSKME